MYMSLRARVAGGLIKQPARNYRPSQRIAHTVNVLIERREERGEEEEEKEEKEIKRCNQRQSYRKRRWLDAVKLLVLNPPFSV